MDTQYESSYDVSLFHGIPDVPCSFAPVRQNDESHPIAPMRSNVDSRPFAPMRPNVVRCKCVNVQMRRSGPKKNRRAEKDPVVRKRLEKLTSTSGLALRRIEVTQPLVAKFVWA